MFDGEICDTCKRHWPEFSEQAESVRVAGFCIACSVRSRPYTDDEWSKITVELHKTRFRLIAEGFHDYLVGMQS